MRQTVKVSPDAPSLMTCTAFTCPVQVLVIDAPNGPADILANTISLLVEQDVSVMTVDDHTDALRALAYYDFDLVVVGLAEHRPLQLTILPHIYAQDVQRPILAVGVDLPRLYQQYARTYGAREVLNVPRSAADLKKLVARMSTRYFSTMHTELA